MKNSSDAYVFISYCHDDSDFASAFSARLRKAGIRHFRDTEAIAWGEHIPARIHSALEEATHLVALISPGGEQSQWVSYEMGFARGKNIILVPYLLHPKMKVPGFLLNLRYLSNESDEADFIKSLKTFKKAGSAANTRKSAGAENKEMTIKQGLKKIRSDHPLVRQDGIDTLVDFNEIDHLMTLLGGRDRGVRAAAAEGLARLRHEDAIEYLISGLGFTGTRSESPIIPGVEEFFVYYGDLALEPLLSRIPDILVGDEAQMRWTTALLGAASKKTATLLLEKAIETGRKEFMTAALSPRVRFKKDQLAKAIDSCLSMAYYKYGAQQTLARLLARSANSTSLWVRRLVKEWFVIRARYYDVDSRNVEWTVIDLCGSALTMGAISTKELRELSSLVKNNYLKAALFRVAEEWKDESGT